MMEAKAGWFEEDFSVPKFEKLSAADVEKLGKRRMPTLDLSEYLAFLDRVQPGDWGRLTLLDGESQRTIKRRLTSASKQKGLTVKYRKSPEGQILFQVREADAPAD